jgi:hypothetical protein
MGCQVPRTWLDEVRATAQHLPRVPAMNVDPYEATLMLQGSQSNPPDVSPFRRICVKVISKRPAWQPR